MTQLSEVDELKRRIVQVGQNEWAWSLGFNSLYDLAMEVIGVADSYFSAGQQLLKDSVRLADDLSIATNSARTDALANHDLTRERDAARALADQLAAALRSGNGDYWSEDSSLIDSALEAYGARDWRPISPPGSGLDGLMADINREKP